jgi:hypothetical protein
MELPKSTIAVTTSVPAEELTEITEAVVVAQDVYDEE